MKIIEINKEINKHNARMNWAEHCFFKNTNRDKSSKPNKPTEFINKQYCDVKGSELCMMLAFKIEDVVTFFPINLKR